MQLTGELGKSQPAMWGPWVAGKVKAKRGFALTIGFSQCLRGAMETLVECKFPVQEQDSGCVCWGQGGTWPGA